MTGVRSLLLPAGFCLVFLLEGLASGSLMNHRILQPLAPDTEGIIRESLAAPVPSVLNHVSWEIRHAQPGSAPLAHALRMRSSPDPLARRISGCIRGEDADQDPLASDVDDFTILASPEFQALTTPLHAQPPAARQGKGTPIIWNGEMNVAVAVQESLDFQPMLNRLAPPDVHMEMLRTRAAAYSGSIATWSRRFHVQEALICAIISVESEFTPRLVSSQSAHGLMQVVPYTAGEEVRRWLGGSGYPSPEELFTPAINIKYGTGYLRLLFSRYFGRVINPQSREYCVIAAYNGGAGPVLKAFSQNSRSAIDVINQQHPEAVLNTLLDRLPSGETRQYLRKVLAAKEFFAADRLSPSAGRVALQ